jgi:hypothetical protein
VGGGIVELQINVPQMLFAKEKMGGHLLYEIGGDAELALERGSITVKQYAKMMELFIQAQEKLYDAAFEAVLAGAIFNASSLDMYEQLGNISLTLQEEGLFSNVLSENTLKKIQSFTAKGRSSQSTNLSEGSSQSGIETSIDTLQCKYTANYRDVK